MAKPDIITLKGKVGNLVFYYWKGKPVLRSHPGRIKQTKATKKCAALFGKASKMSRVIREELKDILPDYKDHSMRLRFNAAIYQWLQANEKGITDNSALNGFEFNDKHPLSSRLKNMPEVDWSVQGKVIIRFKEMNLMEDIVAPVHASKFIITTKIIDCPLHCIQNITSQHIIKSFDYSPGKVLDAHEYEFCNHNSIIIVILSLNYELNGVLNRNLRWWPIAINSIN